MNILYDKNICFLGSSVTYGYKSDGIAFPEFIEENNGCHSYKYALSGTTLVNNSSESYYARLLKIDKKIKFDLFVCQLSTNDAYMKYDIAKILIAIDNIAEYVKETWNCPVVFYTSPYYDNEEYKIMVRSLNQVKEDFGIYVIDMFSDQEFNNISSELKEKYMTDPIHPSVLGYKEWLTPYMEKDLIKIMEKNV